jgi:protein FRA10AC1
MSYHPSHHRKRSRNPSPPSFVTSKGRNNKVESARKIINLTSAADHAELEKHYTFVPSDEKKNTWQERMLNHYHSHLYKEYVLADMSRAPSQLGLRWRTQQEVQNGRGHATCGNKHCPGGSARKSLSKAAQLLLESYYQSPHQPESEEEEEKLLARLPHGAGLHDYEVPFTYIEQGETKTELVKLRLCLRCSPLLFKGGALDARRARSKLHDNANKVYDHESLPEESINNEDPPQAMEQKKRAYSSDGASISDHEERKSRRRHGKPKKKKAKRHS